MTKQSNMKTKNLRETCIDLRAQLTSTLQLYVAAKQELNQMHGFVANVTATTPVENAKEVLAESKLALDAKEIGEPLKALRAAVNVISVQNHMLTEQGKGLNLSTVQGYEGQDFIETLAALCDQNGVLRV